MSLSVAVACPIGATAAARRQALDSSRTWPGLRQAASPRSGSAISHSVPAGIDQLSTCMGSEVPGVVASTALTRTGAGRRSLRACRPASSTSTSSASSRTGPGPRDPGADRERPRRGRPDRHRRARDQQGRRRSLVRPRLRPRAPLRAPDPEREPGEAGKPRDGRRQVRRRAQGRPRDVRSAGRRRPAPVAVRRHHDGQAGQARLRRRYDAPRGHRRAVRPGAGRHRRRAERRR